MYGGPRRPNSSPFQGRGRPLPPNFRPQFQNPGFYPPRYNVYPPQFGEVDFRPRQPYPPNQGPFGVSHRPDGPVQGFQSREWHMQGVRQGFRPTGFQGRPRHRGRGGYRRDQDASGIEAYYSHSMVEDPWKELEEKHKEKSQQP